MPLGDGAGRESGRIRRAVGAVLIAPAIVLAACASDGPSLPKISDLNPFKEKATPLPGRRIPVVETTDSIASNLALADQPIILPPQRANESWPQSGGEANNAPGNLALNGAVRQAWSQSAGEGSSKAGRVMASPIVFDGKVFTLDAEANVSAFSMAGGKIFKVSTAPETESDGGGGHGGGLAGDNGRLFVANGFGVVASLDPGSGKVLWQKNLGAPVRAAPTVAGDKIFVVTVSGRFFCLSTLDGAEIWSVRGLPQQASLTTSTSPAVDGDIVVVPYPSGDLMALKVADGSPVWTESLARTRATSQLASMSDASRPAIDGGTVYAVGHAGRMIATNAHTGERLWTVNVPSMQTPCVAGDTVYVVDTSGKLMALSRADGSTRWTASLPETRVWSGPVLAGGTLWLASGKGRLIGVDAATGKVGSAMDLGDPVYIPPIVAQGRMFVLTDTAKLIALN
ncbi:MAG TPA: PQQ-binding-like beta-propeller repeat protein [Hyphomicrobium sp.]|nr:PQQ-binding-like beta-propeller repeat protein [Hyphomicrobium sp.]